MKLETFRNSLPLIVNVIEILYLEGAAISAHWVTLQSIGEDGYCDLTKKLIDITQRFKDAVDKIKVVALLT